RQETGHLRADEVRPGRSAGKQWPPGRGVGTLARRSSGEARLMTDEDTTPPDDGPDGELLTGGRTTPGVVRIGNAVHRPVRAWTTTVHAVLRHLERAGFPEAPRVLGFDDRGREVLSYL